MSTLVRFKHVISPFIDFFGNPSICIKCLKLQLFLYYCDKVSSYWTTHLWRTLKSALYNLFRLGDLCFVVSKSLNYFFSTQMCWQGIETYEMVSSSCKFNDIVYSRVTMNNSSKFLKIIRSNLPNLLTLYKICTAYINICQLLFIIQV